MLMGNRGWLVRLGGRRVFMGAGDDQGIRFLKDAANFLVHLPRAEANSALAEWPIWEPWLLETKVLLSLHRTGHNRSARHTSIFVRTWQVHNECDCLSEVARAVWLRVINVYSVLGIKEWWERGHACSNYSNACRIIEPWRLHFRAAFLHHHKLLDQTQNEK